MGSRVIDQYSLLHTAVGIIAYFWGISWYTLLIVHILFEILENTQVGMTIINTYMPFWPGGKPRADSVLNQISDNAFSLLGWFVSQQADRMSVEKHLYP
jgi:hypothetical protein